jgi:hypothetical protein
MVNARSRRYDERNYWSAGIWMIQRISQESPWDNAEGLSLRLMHLCRIDTIEHYLCAQDVVSNTVEYIIPARGDVKCGRKNAELYSKCSTDAMGISF